MELPSRYYKFLKRIKLFMLYAIIFIKKTRKNIYVCVYIYACMHSVYTENISGDLHWKLVSVIASRGGIDHIWLHIEVSFLHDSLIKWVK